MRGGVLVHCWAGVSRSVSCICAYLMESEGYTFHEALNYVRINRPVANPNEGFRQQLELYEQVRYFNKYSVPVCAQGHSLLALAFCG